jgi:hypothetical protein
MSIPIVGLVPGVAKLVETVRQFHADWTSDKKIVRDATAQAEAIKITHAAAAEAEASALLVRARAYRDAEDIFRQRNREAVMEAAVGLLPENVVDEPVSTGWTAAFFSYAQNASDEGVRSLWAKILAGEIEQPGRFSLRALQAVSLLARDEAANFTTLCRYAWDLTFLDSSEFDSQSTCFILELGHANAALSSSALFHLYDIGLIGDPSHGPGRRTGIRIGPKDRVIFRYFDRQWLLPPRAIVIEYGILRLTRAGLELRSVCGALPDEQYLRWFLSEGRACMFRAQD